MNKIDFAIGWSDPVEKDFFLGALSDQCKAHRLSFLPIDTKNLKKISNEVKKGETEIRFYFDMASETFDQEHPFTKFVYLLKDNGTRIVDDPDDVKSAADKSITHFDLVRSGITVPYTVFIRKWEPTRRLTREEEKRLGGKFVIKPALGYGQQGIKVITGRYSLKEIAEARKFSPGDNFLPQEFIEPKMIGDRPAWFRIYQLFGEIIPCWWNPETHVYQQVTLREMYDYRLLPLARIASEIGRITRVDWFSCEIAINAKNKHFVAIDYMNDQCAIYPKSEHKDGVPDDLILHIAERLVEKAWCFIRGERTLTYRAIWFPKIQVKDENI